ncbi:hypothetical protein DL239_15700 [Sedimentitalea sp. CY04]|uniref:Cytochrome c domain-containing protein n=1 Tax=Parasedimentitalea denitrificans TaxID=2211118 RepID=A0ABX0WA55_9RHOB|nr:hypothetical protein [Sedimentitalea sp. CY04]NIZ62417.1 hypothetical protein [Sedimentitalea sp. CY04]
MTRLIVLIYVCLSFAPIARADDRLVRLFAPAELVESGFLKHLLPRFSLKTQVRVLIVSKGQAHDIAFGAEGVAVFVGPDTAWHMQVLAPQHPGVQRFTKWLLSDVGQRTITSYAPDSVQMFDLPREPDTDSPELEFVGDVATGRDLSRQLCGRCHVVSETERMNDIGSTPSFFVLRTLANWADRFQTFYVLNPHPSFTQVQDVTAPFAHTRPPPIVPLEMTLDQLEAILAYVARLEPADLGAPLQHQ